MKNMRTMFHRNNKLNENDESKFNAYDICREILDDYDAESLGWIGSSDIDNFLDRYYPDMSNDDRWWVYDRIEKFVDVDDYRSVKDDNYDDEDDYDEDEDDYDEDNNDEDDDDISNPFKIQNGILLKYIGKDANVVIPHGVTSIGDEAFEGRTSLTSVTIPDSVTSIGEYAFSGCTSLTSVTIPDSVTEIGKCAFSQCRGMTSVTIPDSVTSIGSSAFSNCNTLTNITIPNSITTIKGWVFSYCYCLTSVTIPDSVTEIGECAFYRCTALKYIKCPKHLADELKSDYPNIEIVTANRTNENVRMKRSNDRSLLESLIRKYGKNGVKHAINEMMHNDRF